MNKKAFKSAVLVTVFTLVVFEAIGCLGLLINRDNASPYVDFRNMAHQSVILVISLGVGISAYFRKKNETGK
jgi:hypothetical protein